MESVTASVHEAAVRASLELRRYLAVASGDPALFETHEEFITRQDSLACLDETARCAWLLGICFWGEGR